MTDYILPLSMTGIWQTIAVIRGCSFGRQLRSSGAAVLTDNCGHPGVAVLAYNCGHPGLQFWKTTAGIRGARIRQTTSVIWVADSPDNCHQPGWPIWQTTAIILGAYSTDNCRRKVYNKHFLYSKCSKENANVLYCYGNKKSP